MAHVPIPKFSIPQLPPMPQLPLLPEFGFEKVCLGDDLKKELTDYAVTHISPPKTKQQDPYSKGPDGETGGPSGFKWL